MRTLLTAVAAEPASALQSDLNDLSQALLAVVIASMVLALAWMLTGVRKESRPASGGDPASGAPEYWSDIGEELDRSRRFAHAFSLVRIATPSRTADAVKRRPQMEVEVVNSTLRSFDRAWVVDHAILMMLPESTREQAEALVERIRAYPLLQLKQAQVSIASFPVDGITSGALLGALSRGAMALSDQTTVKDPAVPDVADVADGEPRRELPQGEPAR